MTEEQKQRLEELREEQYRKSQQDGLMDRLNSIIPEQSYSFLSPEYSNTFQNQTDPWPKLKWEKELYVQTEMSNPGIVTTILAHFLKLNPHNYTYLFFMNFHFGLVKIDNDVLFTKWPALVEADGDEILCFLPHRSDYICIERLEEKMVGKEELGYHWLYEVTFSNEHIKSELMTEG
ncbi:MAG TPA: hypothetical protein VLC98_00630 [Phnomibacter sp.]|nr:hypothetical protein [Phnomibacter sp.]